MIYKVVFIVIYFPKNPNIVEFSDNLVLMYREQLVLIDRVTIHTKSHKNAQNKSEPNTVDWNWNNQTSSRPKKIHAVNEAMSCYPEL